MGSGADGAGAKRTFEVALPDAGTRSGLAVTVGVIVGSEPGPSGAVVAGIHGTELVGQDAALALWRDTQPQDVRGTLTVVFVANVHAAETACPAMSPADGVNFNRVWPGSEGGTWSARAVARLWAEVLHAPNVVIDVHGGEWVEEGVPFALAHRGVDGTVDPTILRIAQAMELPYVLVTAGTGTLTSAVARDGRIGVAMEVGGRGRRARRERMTALGAIRGALHAAGVLATEPAVHFGAPHVLDGSEIVRATRGGVMVSRVQAGQRVAKGDALATVHTFDGRPIETVTSPTAAVVMLRSVARVIAPGAMIASLGWSTDVA